MASLKPPTLVMRLLTSPSSLGPDLPSHGTNENPRPAKTFTTEVGFDSDDLSSLASGDMTGRVLHSLTDLSRDGVADLVVFSVEGASISSKRSTYEVHFGAPTPEGGTAFARGVDIAFQSDGIQLGMDRRDFDRDGQVDLMFTTIETRFLENSLWKRIKGFMGDDIWLDLEFYQTKDGLYPDKSNAVRRIALDGVPSHREPGWVPLDIVLRGRGHFTRCSRGPEAAAGNRAASGDDTDRPRMNAPGLHGSNASLASVCL